MLSKNQLGFLYMFMSVCAFSIMDLIVKWSDSYPLGQVLFFRGFFGLVFYFFIIPIKPTTTASHLNNPTFSLSKKIDKIVVKIGAANEMLTTVAKGKFLSAVNIARSAIKPKKHLKKCKPGLLV